LEALVEASADVNAFDAERKLLLHLLAAQGKPEQVIVLLAGGADGTLRSIGGHVAFNLAKHNPSVKWTAAYWR
jgi:ankyrin repeat protein